MFGGRGGENEALQQRVAGHAIRPVKPGETGFADGVKVGNVGQAVRVRDDAPAGIVGGRHDGYGALRDIDAQLQTSGIDSGEM